MIRLRSILWGLVFSATVTLAQRAPIAEQLTFVPDHASGVYNVGEVVGWTVTPGPVDPAYRFKWTIRRNNAVVLKEGTLDLSTGKARIEIQADEPEMIYVAVEPTAKLDGSMPMPEAPAAAAGPGRGNPSGFTGGNTGRNNGLYAVGAAVAPLKLRPVSARPADFDAFWGSKLAAQAAIPINPVLTAVETEPRALS